MEEQQKRKTMDMGQKFVKRPLTTTKRPSTGPSLSNFPAKKPFVPSKSQQIASNTPIQKEKNSNTPNLTQKVSPNFTQKVSPNFTQKVSPNTTQKFSKNPISIKVFILMKFIFLAF